MNNRAWWGLVITLLVLFLLALVGCAGPTQYVDRLVEVKINVPVPCLKAGDVPTPIPYPVDLLGPGDSDGDIIGALVAERQQRADMEQALRGILESCMEN